MLTEIVSLIPNGPMRLVHIWMLVTSATFVSIIASSGLVFYLLYWPSNVTYNKWRYKVRIFWIWKHFNEPDNWYYFQSNPAYPPVEKVRDEILQMVKGLCCSAIFPSLSLYFSGWSNLSQGFSGWGGTTYLYCWLLIAQMTVNEPSSLLFAGYGISYHLATALVVWVGSDFYEFAYHRLGHVSFPFWKQHKHHHVFFNPSPFAVIADEWIDQVVRLF